MRPPKVQQLFFLLHLPSPPSLFLFDRRPGSAPPAPPGLISYLRVAIAQRRRSRAVKSSSWNGTMLPRRLLPSAKLDYSSALLSGAIFLSFFSESLDPTSLMTDDMQPLRHAQRKLSGDLGSIAGWKGTFPCVIPEHTTTGVTSHSSFRTTANHENAAPCPTRPSLHR